MKGFTRINFDCTIYNIVVKAHAKHSKAITLVIGVSIHWTEYCTGLYWTQIKPDFSTEVI